MQVPQQPRKPQQPLASPGEPHPRDELKNVQQNCQQSIRHVAGKPQPRSFSRETAAAKPRPRSLPTRIVPLRRSGKPADAATFTVPAAERGQKPPRNGICPIFGTMTSARRQAALNCLICPTGCTGHCRMRAVRGLCAPTPILRGSCAPTPRYPAGMTAAPGPAIALTCLTGPRIHHAPRPHGVEGPLPPSEAFARGVRGPRPHLMGVRTPSPRYPAAQPSATAPTHAPEPQTGVTVHDPGRRPGGPHQQPRQPRRGRPGWPGGSTGAEIPLSRGIATHDAATLPQIKPRVNSRRVLELHERGIQAVPPGTGGARGAELLPGAPLRIMHLAEQAS